MKNEAPPIRTRTSPHCFLCGSAGAVLYQDLKDRYFGVSGVWQLKQCPREDCGLLWLDPAPVEADLHLAYQNYFTHSASESGTSNFANQLRGLFYRIYELAQLPVSVPIGLHRSRRRMNHMYLDDLKPGRVLDVGCGNGTFLNRMRNVGWTVDGVDFDAKALAQAKVKYGLDLHCGDLASMRFPDDSFDAVTMSHVIEHLPDPLTLLTEIRRILKPGGRLVLTTPNSPSLGHKKYQSYWFGVDAPRHLNIYSQNTLTECARRIRLEPLRVFSTSAHADVFYGGSLSIRDAVDHEAKGVPGLNPIKILKVTLLQYLEHCRLRRQPDCGEEVVMMVVKPAKG